MSQCGRCHTCGAKLKRVLDGEESTTPAHMRGLVEAQGHALKQVKRLTSQVVLNQLPVAEQTT